MVERGPLRGRDQEWNISRKELNELVGCTVTILLAQQSQNAFSGCKDFRNQKVLHKLICKFVSYLGQALPT